MTGVYKRRRTESIRDTQRRSSREDRSRDWSDISKPRNAKGCQQPPGARRCFYYLSDYSIKAYNLKVCYLKYLLDHCILFKNIYQVTECISLTSWDQRGKILVQRKGTTMIYHCTHPGPGTVLAQSMSLTEYMEGVHTLYFCCTQSVFLQIKGLFSFSSFELLACFFVNSPKVLAGFDDLGLKTNLKIKF